MKGRLLYIILVGLLGFWGCGVEEIVGVKDVIKQEGAIINGKADKSEEHHAVVMLSLKDFRDKKHYYFCTGTLISPKHVLTAAHCIVDENNAEEEDKLNIQKNLSKFYVSIGYSADEIHHRYRVKQAIPHPKYDSDNPITSNDVAILELVESVSETRAKPILPLLAMDVIKKSNVKGMLTEFVGFGLTEAYDLDITVKLTVSREFDDLCIVQGKGEVCEYKMMVENEEGEIEEDLIFVTSGSLFYTQDNGGPCSGDSGGPAFVKVKGNEYIAGITSYGDEYCVYYGVSMAVQHYRDFIVQHAPEVLEEVCVKQKSNEADGKVSCSDAFCKSAEVCKVQCEEVEGKVDCNLEVCKNHLKCQAEVCDNKVDDNGDGKIDCDDLSCQSFAGCQVKVEICDNKVDDNGDGKIDCDDLSCQSFAGCQVRVEICDNKVDDNGDGKIDCDDLSCQSFAGCQVRVEICDNKVDDNGDGKIDCDDLSCSDFGECKKEGTHDKNDDQTVGHSKSGGSSCSVGGVGGQSHSSVLILVLGILSMAVLRRGRKAEYLDI